MSHPLLKSLNSVNNLLSVRTKFAYLSEPLKVYDITPSLLFALEKESGRDNLTFIEKLYSEFIGSETSEKEQLILNSYYLKLNDLTVLSHLEELNQLFFDIRTEYVWGIYSSSNSKVISEQSLV